MDSAYGTLEFFASRVQKTELLHSKSNQLPLFAVENLTLHLVGAGEGFTTCGVGTALSLSRTHDADWASLRTSPCCTEKKVYHGLDR